MCLVCQAGKADKSFVSVSIDKHVLAFDVIFVLFCLYHKFSLNFCSADYWFRSGLRIID